MRVAAARRRNGDPGADRAQQAASSTRAMRANSIESLYNAPRDGRSRKAPFFGSICAVVNENLRHPSGREQPQD